MPCTSYRLAGANNLGTTCRGPWTLLSATGRSIRLFPGIVASRSLSMPRTLQEPEVHLLVPIAMALFRTPRGRLRGRAYSGLTLVLSHNLQRAHSEIARLRGPLLDRDTSMATLVCKRIS